MNHVMEFRRQRQTLLDQADALLATATGEQRGLTDEEQTNLEAMQASIANLQRQEQLAEQTSTMQSQLRSAPGVQPNGPATINRRTPDTSEGVFCRYLRSQDHGALRELRQATEAEQRASNDTTMNITTAADGGDLVPVGHYRGIIERLRPQALYNQLGVRMIPGQGTTVNVPIDNEADSGEFVSTNESGEFDRDAPAVAKVAMTLVKYTKRLDLTYELLQDEDSRVMDFLAIYVAQGMAATMNKLLITEALADGTAALTLDSATAIGAAEIPELLYKLPAEYARGANVAWLMERATEGYLRGLASSNQFVFANTPAATGNGTGAATLWGVPLFTDDNMGSLAASGKSMLIGNWAYMGMRLDPAITFLLDPYSRASYGETRMHYYFRTDFEVLQAGAFRYATHPTA